MFQMERSVAHTDARACLGIFKRFHKLFLNTTFFWILQGSGCNLTSDFEIVVGKKAAGLGLSS